MLRIIEYLAYEGGEGIKEGVWDTYMRQVDLGGHVNDITPIYVDDWLKDSVFSYVQLDDIVLFMCRHCVIIIVTLPT